MSAGDRDYLLGTHHPELARLRVWRSTVLACWDRAGITVGSRVLDVGAGPGFATLDLAEIVGPTGEVIAVERSARFVQHTHDACRARGFDHVRLHELDLTADPLPARDLDAAWSMAVSRAHIWKQGRTQILLATTYPPGRCSRPQPIAVPRSWSMAAISSAPPSTSDEKNS